MKAMSPDRNRRYSTADEMLYDLEAFRKDPTVSFDYSADDLRPEKRGADEPTQYLPNVAVTRAKQNARRTPVPVVEDEDEEDERPRSGWWKTLLLILIVAAVGWFGGTRLLSGIMDSFAQQEIPEYTVPSVVGMTVEEAMAAPEVSGIFEIVEDAVHEYSTEYGKDEIIRQDPEAERVRKSASGDLIPIKVTVSLGARSGEMLDVVGQESRGAKLLLEQTRGLSELHLNVVEAPEQEYHDTIQAGHVIRTDPAAGTALSEGDTVTLFVSRGPKIKYSTMVPCVGETMAFAQEQMDQLNLIAEFTQVEGAAPAGTILTQSVDTGTEVEQGTTVTFTYSDGEKLLEQTIAFDVPYSPEEVHVQIYLGEDAIYDNIVPGDYGRLEQTVQRKAGDYPLRIYAGGQLWRDEVMTFSEQG